MHSLREDPSPLARSSVEGDEAVLDDDPREDRGVADDAVRLSALLVGATGDAPRDEAAEEGVDAMTVAPKIRAAIVELGGIEGAVVQAIAGDDGLVPVSARAALEDGGAGGEGEGAEVQAKAGEDGPAPVATRAALEEVGAGGVDERLNVDLGIGERDDPLEQEEPVSAKRSGSSKSLSLPP